MTRTGLLCQRERVRVRVRNVFRVGVRVRARVRVSVRYVRFLRTEVSGNRTRERPILGYRPWLARPIRMAPVRVRVRRFFDVCRVRVRVKTSCRKSMRGAPSTCEG